MIAGSTKAILTATKYLFHKDLYIGVQYSVSGAAPNLLSGFYIHMNEDGSTGVTVSVRDNDTKKALTKTFEAEKFNVENPPSERAVFFKGKSPEEALRFIHFFNQNVTLIEDKALAEIVHIFEKGLPSEMALWERIYNLAQKKEIQAAYDEACTANQMGFKDTLYKLGLVFLDLNYKQQAYTCFSSVDKECSNYQNAQLKAGELCPHILKAQGKTFDEIVTQTIQHGLEAGPQGQAMIDAHFIKACDFPEHQVPQDMVSIRPDVGTLIKLAKTIAAQNAEIEALRQKFGDFSIHIDKPK